MVRQKENGNRDTSHNQHTYQRLTATNSTNISNPNVDDDIAGRCDIYRKENLAIAMSYFAVGLVSSFISTPLNVYLVETLNAEPTMQNTINILQTLPWSLKLVFGFMSDAFPIFGMHRKPYMAIGAILYSTAFIIYAAFQIDDIAFLSCSIFLGTVGLIILDVMADTMCVQRSKFEDEKNKGQMQSTCYSIRFGGSLLGAICGSLLDNQKAWGWGLNFFQVAFINGLIPFICVIPCMSSLVEKFHKEESPETHPLVVLEMETFTNGHVPHSHANDNGPESTIYISKPVNGVNQDRMNQPTSYQSLSNSTQNPLLHNDSSNSVSSYHNNNRFESTNRSIVDPEVDVPIPEEEYNPIRSQMIEIWETVQLKSVWQPMAFVYLFNLFQVPNVAWQSFLQLGLNFEPWILGLTVVIGTFMTFAGILAYKYFFFSASWRKIYIWSVCLTSFFSLSQLILIFQINKTYLHLNNYLFSLGDDVITAYISGIQFLPVCIMYMRLCPEGAEGTSYAMLTTFGNIALVCASNVGNLLAGVWDVSNAAMKEHNYSGLWKLNLLTSCLAVVPLSLLFLLPKNAEEQDVLAKSQERSKTAGVIFLIILFGSLFWTGLTAVTRISEE